jgi:hypothetical protein
VSVIEKSKPQVTRRGALDMQVCVPKDWSDERVKEFADRENPCGTQLGWTIRKQGDEALAGANERVACNGCDDFVHVILDA